MPIEEENGNENTWLNKGFEIIMNFFHGVRESIISILDLHAAPGGQGYDEGISDYDPNLPSLWESSKIKIKQLNWGNWLKDIKIKMDRWL